MLALAAADANIVVAQRDMNKANSFIKELEQAGTAAIAVNVDVTNAKSIKTSVQQALNRFSKIDILVNNAGVLTETPAGTSIEDFDLSYEVNLKGVWQTVNGLLPHFRENKGGKIINIASIAGRQGNVDLPAYRASKAGVINLTQSLAASLGADNINVNAICPGIVKTAMADYLGHAHNVPDFYDEVAKSNALQRIATSEDIGHAVVFLASSQAQNITGQSLNVDGGVVQAMS